MKPIFSLLVDQDWVSDSVKENSILRFLGKQYDKDRMMTLYVFEVIGAPVSDVKTEIILT